VLVFVDPGRRSDGVYNVISTVCDSPLRPGFAITFSLASVMYFVSFLAISRSCGLFAGKILGYASGLILRYPRPCYVPSLVSQTHEGFAFCDFQTKAMADECVRDMDGLKMENLAITVEIARRSVFVRLLSSCMLST